MACLAATSAWDQIRPVRCRFADPADRSGASQSLCVFFAERSHSIRGWTIERGLAVAKRVSAARQSAAGGRLLGLESEKILSPPSLRQVDIYESRGHHRGVIAHVRRVP